MDITHRVGSRTTRGRLSRLFALSLLIVAVAVPMNMTTAAAAPSARPAAASKWDTGPIDVRQPLSPIPTTVDKPEPTASPALDGPWRRSDGPFAVKPGYWLTVDIYCPSGTVATGGGEYNNKTGITLRDSYALFGGGGWHIEVHNLTQVTADITAYVLCAGGITDYALYHGKSVLNPGETAGVYAHCPNNVRLIGNGGYSDIWNTKIYLYGSPTFRDAGYVAYNGDGATHTINSQVICANGLADVTSAGGNEVSPPVGQMTSSLALCPAGTRVLSGGGITVNGAMLRLTDSYPEGEGWRAYFYNDGVQIATSKAVAICGR